MSTRLRCAAFAAAILAAGAPPVVAQSVVYPAGGQTPEQQAKDQAECNAWAQQTTGVDPAVVAQQAASQPAPTGGQGQRARGALGGAAAGALIGGITDSDVGEAAAVGAVVGTIGGGRRQRQQQEQQQAQYQAQQQQAQQAIDAYVRAVNACMQGRNYVVN
jgi:hypothetical protein